MAAESTRARLERLVSERILLLDGAMGTMIQRHKLARGRLPRRSASRTIRSDLKGNNDMLVLTRPDVDRATSTTSTSTPAPTSSRPTRSTATPIAQADYELEPIVYEINVAAARSRARPRDEWTAKTPDQPRFVAGRDRARPTARSRSRRTSTTRRSARVTFDEVRDAYAEQVRGLIDGGVDLLLVETIFDTLNAKAALVAIEEVLRGEGHARCRS